MIRATLLATVVLGIGIATFPAQAQLRTKPGGNAAHFNPKELTVDKKAPWKSQQSAPNRSTKGTPNR